MQKLKKKMKARRKKTVNYTVKTTFHLDKNAFLWSGRRQKIVFMYIAHDLNYLHSNFQWKRGAYD